MTCAYSPLSHRLGYKKAWHHVKIGKTHSSISKYCPPPNYFSEQTSKCKTFTLTYFHAEERNGFLPIMTQIMPAQNTKEWCKTFSRLKFATPAGEWEGQKGFGLGFGGSIQKRWKFKKYRSGLIRLLLFPRLVSPLSASLKRSSR